MVLIWRGWGILVALVPLAAFIVAAMVAGALESALGPAFDSSMDWLFPLGFLASAVVLWVLGRRLNNRDTRVLVDMQTGEQIAVRPNHSFWFIKMEYWAIVLAAFGTLTFF